MKTKGKAWQLVLTVLLIAAFVYTAFFGVAVKYGDVTTTYIKGAKDIRFGVDIKGGVNVTFVPSEDYDATEEQLEAAQLVIENRLVGIANKALELMHKYLTEFGMSPSSRTRGGAKKKTGEKKGFAAL